MASTWGTATAYSIGDIVVPTTLATYYYECTTAGTSHAVTEPTWPTTPGGTVSDNGVVWKTGGKNANANTGQARFTLGAAGDSVTLTMRNLEIIETVGHPDADWVGTNKTDPNSSDYKSSMDVLQISGWLIGTSALSEGNTLMKDIFKPRKRHSRGGYGSRYINLELSGNYATLHDASLKVRSQGSNGCKCKAKQPGVNEVKVDIQVRVVKT